MSLKIRKLKKGEERKTSNLCKKCILEIPKKHLTKKRSEILLHDYSQKELARFAKKSFVYIAVKGDKVLGVTLLFNNQIKGMYVHPEQQAKGIGSQMLEHVESVLEKKDYDFSYLNTLELAEKYYKKLGYKKVKKIDSAIGELITMKKKLIKDSVE